MSSDAPAPIEVEQKAPSRRDSSDNEKRLEPWVDASAVESTQPCESRLISYLELPVWHQDNPFIRHGYRSISRSTTACIRSLTYLHNETLNIYTHLIPAALALFVGEAWVLAYLGRQYEDLGARDYAIFAVLLSAAAVCLGISSAYHTLMSHSQEVEARWLRLDFVGIIVLIVGSFVSGIYVGFWCEPTERKIYWAMSASLGVVSSLVMLMPTLQGPRWRTLRLSVFIVTGLSGFAPIIQSVLSSLSFFDVARTSLHIVHIPMQALNALYAYNTGYG
ncbi:hemolysin-III related-domain-containing protein [Astrocystis sublimbata]|nr:hemolysin-III related-domain-containing protein [Astrocystis sublimbata]